MDRQGQRDADGAIRSRRERLRRRHAPREELLGPPGHVVDRAALAGGLPAPRAGELRAPPAEGIAPAVDREVADPAEVLARLALELALDHDLLGRQCLQVEG